MSDEPAIYERIGRWYEDGFDSPGNTELRLDAERNVGGSYVTVRYYLGMLYGKNFYALSWKKVAIRLASHLRKTTSKKGSQIAFSPAGPDVVWRLLRYDFHMQFQPTSAKNSKALDSLRYLLRNPNASASEIAVGSSTTRKQVLRQANTKYAMRLLREVGSRTREQTQDRD